MLPQCARSNHNGGRVVHSIDDEEWNVKAERRSSVKMKSAIYRGKGPTGVSKSTSRDNLVALFGVPLSEAAVSLGVSTTIIKRLCRRHHIPRWPYRRLLSIEKQIARVRKEMEDDIDVKNKYIPSELRKLSTEREDILACRFEELEPRLKGNAINSGVKIEKDILNEQNDVGPLHLKMLETAALPFRDPKNGNNVSDLTSEQHTGISSSSSSPETLQICGIKQRTALSTQLEVDNGNSELNNCELNNSDRAGGRVKEYYSAAFRELALSVASSCGQDSKSPTSGCGGLEQLYVSFQEFSKLPTLGSAASGVGGSPSDSINALSPLPPEGVDLAHLDPTWSSWFTSTPRIVEDRVSVTIPISYIENLSPAPCIGLQSF